MSLETASRDWSDDDWIVLGRTCNAETEVVGARVRCHRPTDHEGDHGSGPFVEYTVMWPATQSGTTEEKKE